MQNSIHPPIKKYKRRGPLGESGSALLESAILLPLMLIIIFAIVDFGRLFNARFVITSLAREGGSLASRDIQSPADLINMLQIGASPLDLKTSGKIFISKISAGPTEANPSPTITSSTSQGALSAANSTISAGSSTLGLSSAMYEHLVFDTSHSGADISGVTVVEVFYKYTPITPLSTFIPGLMTQNGGGIIIGSKAVF
jgi:hypothetical protein